jgi:hypothetical protein
MSGFEPIGELLPEVNRKGRRRPGPDDAVLTEKEELVLELAHLGVGLRKARSLVDEYPAERIERQLNWLPLRAARRPASLLISAIENNYDPPVYASE